MNQSNIHFKFLFKDKTRWAKHPMSTTGGYIGISLSSGSTRGIYQLGALHAADLNGLLVNTRYYAGTSIGSVIAMLLAVGWRPLDLFSHVCVHDFTQLLDLTKVDLTTAITKWGAIDSTPLREYIRKLILIKYGGVPTFGQLAKEGKHLIVTAYRMKHAHPNVYFTPETHPDMSVLDAVLLSSNIPFVFQARQYDGDFYIDGGCFDLNPTQFLESYIQEEDKRVFSVSLDLRQAICETDIITSFMDYMKEMVFIVMYNQKKIKSTSTIHNIDLSTEVGEDPIMPLVLDKSTKIKWFCSGVEQTLIYFREKHGDCSTNKEGEHTE